MHRKFKRLLSKEIWKRNLSVLTTKPLDPTKLDSEVKLFVPPGHFYSPIVDPSELVTMPSYEPFNGDIEIDLIEMQKLLDKVAKHGQVFPVEKSEGRRYYSNNDQYAEGDAFTYSGILEELQPQKIIEIGSGYSTAVVLDWIESRKLNQEVQVTVIEPYPDRLLSLVFDADEFTLINKRVQDVELDIFKTLQKNDILFIDSSHIGKSGSDVLFELFKILPVLNTGVWIHFHDCF